MQRRRLQQAAIDALLRRQRGEALSGRTAEDVSALQYARVAAERAVRVPDLGDVLRRPGDALSVAWAKVPFQLGAWGVSDPGVLLTPDDSLFLAGEHLSILQGWQEGAILSAYHAIDGIVARDTA